MPLRYLGSKSRLAEQIATQMRRWRQPSVVFDLFAGMGHVSAAFADTTRVVAVDAGPAAAAALRWRLKVGDEWKLDGRAIEAVVERFGDNFRTLTAAFADVQAAEHAWLHSTDDRGVAAVTDALGGPPGAGRMRGNRSVVTAYFGASYFGINQAMQFDALRNAVDDAKAANDLDDEQASTALIGVLCAATHLTNAPGHFAQHFRLTGPRAMRARQLMSRDVLEQWKKELALMRPAGSAGWRAGNMVFERNSLDAWGLFSPDGAAFADPPYTSSQYSRFYHVLDTIIRYDTPACDFRGRYRADRYVSPFCQKSKVQSAFVQLIRRGLEIAPSLYLTYPSNGLLQQSGVSIVRVAEGAGAVATRIASQTLLHSAPGHADGQRPVVEEVWRVRG